ncbi:hypothetical protein [Terriglobus roseus]|uniref:Membrane protein involved in the export of O-antigen and teichoic acid n=1 Tax=Terriglobus roseus TaxID=392734 RepID=A0A1H4RUV3_9BACT|nr:hypothetical protein [Terriglobus roseus]SEC35649.1 Membrane protein involved in the export of O-antigen and teichoic acid [Terriglobus roseus]
MSAIEPAEVNQITAVEPLVTPSLLRRALQATGIDRAIGYTILARGWASIAGLVSVALIARTFSRAEQGYYYTFGSLVALQIIFELGFSVVILQLASHEVAHLKIDPSGLIVGEARPHRRLASVLQKAVVWYGAAGLLMLAVLLPVGWHFFATSPGAGTVAWRAPWTCVVLASCLTFQIDPIFSFLEGCGMVKRIAMMRWQQAVAGSLLSWGIMLLHHGLFSPALVIGAQAGVGFYFLFRNRRLLLGLLRHNAGEDAIVWGTEVWPFQWRIAISYGCGFIIFQLFNPALLRFYGPVVAGQMGMSLSITNSLAAVGMSWLSTKAAPFGSLIARREFVELDRLFMRSVVQSLVLLVCGSLVIWTVDVELVRMGVPFAKRLLAPLPFGLLLLNMCGNQVSSSIGIYLRAHKQEKLLITSILGAVVIGISTVTLGRWYGAIGMTTGQLGATLVIGIGISGYIFQKYRRIWHA